MLLDRAGNQYEVVYVTKGGNYLSDPKLADAGTAWPAYFVSPARRLKKASGLSGRQWRKRRRVSRSHEHRPNGMGRCRRCGVMA